MKEDKNKYILSINGMSKSFGRNKVLKHISMNVKPGTIMGLMGENGAGKSTMMKFTESNMLTNISLPPIKSINPCTSWKTDQV